MLEAHNKKTQTNIKQVQGHLKKISQMINDGEYCIDIIYQMNAAIGLLRRAKNNVLESHLLTCGHAKLSSSDYNTKLNFAKEIINITNNAEKM